MCELFSPLYWVGKNKINFTPISKERPLVHMPISQPGRKRKPGPGPGRSLLLVHIPLAQAEPSRYSKANHHLGRESPLRRRGRDRDRDAVEASE